MLLLKLMMTGSGDRDDDERGGLRLRYGRHLWQLRHETIRGGKEGPLIAPAEQESFGYLLG